MTDCNLYVYLIIINALFNGLTVRKSVCATLCCDNLSQPLLIALNQSLSNQLCTSSQHRALDIAHHAIKVWFGGLHTSFPNFLVIVVNFQPPFTSHNYLHCYAFTVKSLLRKVRSIFWIPYPLREAGVEINGL